MKGIKILHFTMKSKVYVNLDITPTLFNYIKYATSVI